MGQANCRVQIANGFSQHVYVKTDVNIIKCSSDNSVDNVSLEADIKLKIGCNANKTSTSETQAEYHILQQAGFSILPKGEVTSYAPPTDVSNSTTVFATLFYLTEDGVPEILHNNKPMGKKTSWIITRQGGLVESKNGYPWLSLSDEKNHGSEACTTCSTFSGVCEVCYIETKMSLIQESIGTIQVCNLGHSLVELLANLQTEKIISKNKEGQLMLKDIEKLAQKYWLLETKTKRVVRDIQSYGEMLEQAAEDFKHDGNMQDFLDEAKDMTDIKDSLKDVNEQHGEIKKFVSVIQEKAEQGAKIFEKSSEIQKPRWQPWMSKILISTIIHLH